MNDSSEPKSRKIDSLLGLFSSQSQISKIEDRLGYFEAKGTLSEIKSPKSADVELFLKNYTSQYDSFKFNISIGDGDPLTLTSTNKQEDFYKQLDGLSTLSAGESITFHFRVDKSNSGEIAIYDLQKFSEYLDSLTVEEALNVLSNEINKRGNLIFRSEELSRTFNSDTIGFLKGDERLSLQNLAERKSKIERLSTISHSPHWANDTAVLPQDLSFQFETISNDLLKTTLQRLQYATLLFSIFDITNYENSAIYLKLNGYKTISTSVKKENLAIGSLDQYWRIYNWMTTSGSILDKSGIARNIISLHLDVSKGLEISENAFLSIQSSFKIYEKENIKQYIEIRNKISDQLMDYYKRSSQITDNFASGFQKSIFAVLTFFSSVLAVRIISNKTSEGLVDLPTYILTLVFIASSFVYFVYSKKELKIQKERFVNSYKNLKERYSDLLLSDDINRIVNNDLEFNSDLKFISDKSKWYSNLWLLSLLFIFLAISYVCFREGIGGLFIRIVNSIFRLIWNC